MFARPHLSLYRTTVHSTTNLSTQIIIEYMYTIGAIDNCTRFLSQYVSDCIEVGTFLLLYSQILHSALSSAWGLSNSDFLVLFSPIWSLRNWIKICRCRRRRSCSGRLNNKLPVNTGCLNWLGAHTVLVIYVAIAWIDYHPGHKQTIHLEISCCELIQNLLIHLLSFYFVAPK